MMWLKGLNTIVLYNIAAICEIGNPTNAHSRELF